MLVRLRLVGGDLPTASLRRLLAVSAEYGDGRVHLTKRANLQLRGLPGNHGRLTREALRGIESTGLLPVPSHERARNILVSPQSGHAGGRADLRRAAHRLDAAICAEPTLADLPGRFLFTLDDGRGDLLDRLTRPGNRGTDLGLIALDDGTGQLRLGRHWGPVVRLVDAPGRLAALAAEFMARRGAGRQAAWHVRELATPLGTRAGPDPRMPGPAGPLRYGPVPGGIHLRVPDGILTPSRAAELPDAGGVIVTPWRGIFVPSAAAGPR